MKWNRGITVWLLVVVIAAGLAAVSFVPFMLRAAPLVDQPQGQVAFAQSSNPPPYDPDVQVLLETTYLGHRGLLPDPGEPAVVLQKYLEQTAHGYQDRLLDHPEQLAAGLETWKAFVQQYPESRHASAALAKHYRAKAIASGDDKFTSQAVDAYIQATQIGLKNGHIRYSQELSELLVELGDTTRLDEIFTTILAQSKGIDSSGYYFALVFYADGLARLRDNRAWTYFEQAIAIHPDNNIEAINRYAQHLLARGQAAKAFSVLDTYLTPELRMRFVLPAQLRKQAMKELGVDTASADAELDKIQKRLQSGGQWGISLSEKQVSTVQPKTGEVPLFSLGAAIANPAPDPRISTIYGIASSADSYVKTDAIFSPVDTMNKRWPNASPVVAGNSLATVKWANGAAELFRIIKAADATNNNVAARYYNGSAWQAWTALPSGFAADITAIAWSNNVVDVLRVESDHCNIYVSHSTNGQTWGAWSHWASCGDQITAATLSDGTALFVLRATANGNQAASRFWNGTSWSSSFTIIPGGIPVRDLALTAYLAPVNGVKATLWAIHNDNTSVYYSNWNGSSWTSWALWVTGYKAVSSFSTSDGGAYLLFLGTSSDKLSTERFTGSAFNGITSQGNQTLKAIAGLNIDEDAPYEHTDSSDDCRVKAYSSGPICDNQGNCFWTQGVNLAEIIYNEARGETFGSQDTVGWTVRDRAFESLNLGAGCTTYPGAEGGGQITSSCRSALPCNDPYYCGNTQRYCCAMHGGQTQVGLSGFQFDDEHVDINTLSSSGVIWEAFFVGDGEVPDVTTHWCPPGVSGCTYACTGPDSTSGFNTTDASPHGPMEFRSFDYCASSGTSCLRYMGNYCGNSGGSVPPDSQCGQTSQKNDNFFWNKR